MHHYFKWRVYIQCHHKPELEDHIVASGEVTYHRTELLSPAPTLNGHPQWCIEGGKSG